MDNPEEKTNKEEELVVEEVVPQEEIKEKPNVFKKFRYLFVILGAVICLSLVFLFYGYQKLNKDKTTPLLTPAPTPIEEIDEQTSELEEQSASDEIEEIEADLKTTDLSEIDQELEDIETELSP